MFSGSYLNALASALAGATFIMRGLLVASGLIIGLLSPAFAGDYDLPILRGSQPVAPVAPVTTVGPATFTRWSGFYVGGDFSYGVANVDFTGATAPLVAFSLQGTAAQQQFTPSQLQLLGRGADSALGFGGFFGYNSQWQDLIVGIEADYTHTSLKVTAPTSSIARSFPINTAPPITIAAGTITGVNLHNAYGHIDLTDYGEVRGRAGFIVGNLVPYGFVGFVGGRADYSVSATTDATCIAVANTLIETECQGFPLTSSAGQSNALLWGVSAGGGLDWAVTRNVFLRGEFEFIQFAPITNISVPVVNGRVDVGFKF